MAASIIPLASAALDTSPPTATALPPAAVMAATTFSAPALLEAQFTPTQAPSAASDLAMAAPIPLDAPVTIATLPVSLLIMFPLKKNFLPECIRSSLPNQSSQTNCRFHEMYRAAQGFISSVFMNY